MRKCLVAPLGCSVCELIERHLLALLLSLAPLPVFGQSVILDVCSTGTVDIDVFVCTTRLDILQKMFGGLPHEHDRQGSRASLRQRRARGS